MFYFIDITEYTGVTTRHIMEQLDDGGVRSFFADESNPHYQHYLAWLKEGNIPEPWNPSN